MVYLLLQEEVREYGCNVPNELKELSCLDDILMSRKRSSFYYIIDGCVVYSGLSLSVSQRRLNMTKRNEYIPQTVSHPGLTLREKLEELGMSQKEFAVRTGKPEQTIVKVINGENSLTPDMAVQFESVLGIPTNFWLKRQQNYDEAVMLLQSDGLFLKKRNGQSLSLEH